MMDECIKIQKELNLYYPAEDLILSFLLKTKGKIEYAPKAKVYTQLGNFFDNEKRGIKQRIDYKQVITYFRNKQ